MVVATRRNKTQRTQKKRTKPPDSTRNLYVQKTTKNNKVVRAEERNKYKTQWAQSKRTKPPESTRSVYVQKPKTNNISRDKVAT